MQFVDIERASYGAVEQSAVFARRHDDGQIIFPRFEFLGVDGSASHRFEGYGESCPAVGFVSFVELCSENDVRTGLRIGSVECGYFGCHFIEDGIDREVVLLSLDLVAFFVCECCAGFVFVVACELERFLAEW